MAVEKCLQSSFIYLCYPLVHAVNVSDLEKLINQDTADSNSVECKSLQDCMCRSVTIAKVNTVIVLCFENRCRYQVIAI